MNFFRVIGVGLVLAAFGALALPTADLIWDKLHWWGLLVFVAGATPFTFVAHKWWPKPKPAPKGH